MKLGNTTHGERTLLTVAIDASVSSFTPYQVLSADGTTSQTVIPLQTALRSTTRLLQAASENTDEEWQVQCVAGMGGQHARLQRILGATPLNKSTLKPILARVC